MVFPFSVVKGDDDSGRRRLMFSSDRKTRQETARCSVAFWNAILCDSDVEGDTKLLHYERVGTLTVS